MCIYIYTYYILETWATVIHHESSSGWFNWYGIIRPQCSQSRSSKLWQVLSSELMTWRELFQELCNELLSTMYIMYIHVYTTCMWMDILYIYIHIYGHPPKNPPFIISMHMLQKCLLARTINQCKNFVFESGHTEKTNKNNTLGLFWEGPFEKKNIKKTKKQYFRTLWGGPLGEKP